jgi:hypothetical protein
MEAAFDFMHKGADAFTTKEFIRIADIFEFTVRLEPTEPSFPSLIDACQFSQLDPALSIRADIPARVEAKRVVIRVILRRIPIKFVKAALAKFDDADLQMLIQRMGLEVRPLHRAMRHLCQR